MDASLGSLFLSFSAKKLEQLSSRVVDSLNRLPEEAVVEMIGRGKSARVTEARPRARFRSAHVLRQHRLARNNFFCCF